MKADEVLRRYAAGERDFRRISLRGQSFKGKNLSGVDFSEADIRGANFTNAYLKGAKFCSAKAGLPRHQGIILVCVAFLIATGLGLVAGLVSFFALDLLGSFNIKNIILPMDIAAIVMSVFFFFLVYSGYNKAKEARRNNMEQHVEVTVHSSLALTFWGIVVLTISVVLIYSGNFATVVALTILGGVVLMTALLLALTMAGVGVLTGSLAVAVILAGFVAVAGAIARVFVQGGQLSVTWAISFVIASAAVVGLLASYIGFEASTRKRFAWIQMIAINFAALGGTSFRRADLTETDFSRAILKSTDFRESILYQTCFIDARKLEQSRYENPNSSIIANSSVRYLLTHGDVQNNPYTQNKSYDRENLRGAFLKGANLQDASFIGANLSEANLQDADLSRAKLVQTQLDEADLTGATLTGAFIEDWNITSHTKLQGIRCRYVFMRLPTKDDPEPRRKPDNREEEFEDGDFADFIKPIVDTLDLYHNQGVDPRTIAISFKQLAENNPEAELRIAAMEARGQDKFLLRAATAPDADHSKLNAEYFKTYNQIKALAEAEVQALLAEKDSRISSLEGMVETVLQRPSFYAQTYNNQGDTMSNAPRKYTKNYFKGASFAGGFVDADTVHAHQIGGDITNYPPEQRQNLAEAAAEIQQLLQQLEQTYPNATEIEKQSALAVTLQQEIKQNPTFRTRLRNALKEGGIEALKVLFAPIGIPIEMVRGWIEAEAE
jgi:uncharacterized protein YjbI with pentapeptide repeats